MVRHHTGLSPRSRKETMNTPTVSNPKPPHMFKLQRRARLAWNSWYMNAFVDILAWFLLGKSNDNLAYRYFAKLTLDCSYLDRVI